MIVPHRARELTWPVVKGVNQAATMLPASAPGLFQL